MPGSIALSDAVRLSKARNGNHRNMLIDVTDCEGSVARHCSVDSTGSQMSAHLAVQTVSRNSSDHVCRVNVLQSSKEALLLAVANDFSLQEDSNVLK